MRNEHKAVIHAAKVLGYSWEYVSHEYRLYASLKAMSTTILRTNQTM